MSVDNHIGLCIASSRTIIVLLMLFTMISSCQKESLEQFTFDYDTLAENREMWKSLEMKDYAYELFNSNVNANVTYIMVVENGILKAAYNNGAPTAINNFEAITFDLIYSFLEATYSSASSENIMLRDFEIKYDELYYYPEYVRFEFKTKQSSNYTTFTLKANILTNSFDI